MTATLLTEPPRPLEGAADGLDRHRSLTLEQRLEGALESAQVAGLADCPVCHGPLAPVGGGARCGDCGSALS